MWFRETSIRTISVRQTEDRINSATAPSQVFAFTCSKCRRARRSSFLDCIRLLSNAASKQTHCRTSLLSLETWMDYNYKTHYKTFESYSDGSDRSSLVDDKLIYQSLIHNSSINNLNIFMNQQSHHTNDSQCKNHMPSLTTHLAIFF